MTSTKTGTTKKRPSKGGPFAGERSQLEQLQADSELVEAPDTHDRKRDVDQPAKSSSRHRLGCRRAVSRASVPGTAA
jgi:hypothetical protein